MKLSPCNTYITIFLGLFLPLFLEASSNIELKKEIVKEFPIATNTRLECTNSFGKIQLVNWNKNAVKITATIISRASKESVAKQKLEDINVNITSSDLLVKAITNISTSSSSSWFSWGNSQAEFEINYVIFLPSYMNATLNNKYGNIYIPDHQGEVNIGLKYGRLEGGSIQNNLTLDLAYGKASVGNVHNLTSNLAYSDFRGANANIVNIQSKYSKIYLDNTIKMTTNCKYDQYNIGDVNLLNMTGAYDDVKIKNLVSANITTKYTSLIFEHLSKDLALDISYGSVRIEDICQGFDQVVINTRYAPIKIFNTGASEVLISGKYFDANTGENFIKKYSDKQNNSTTVKGFKHSERTKSKITIQSSYGDVLIK